MERPIFCAIDKGEGFVKSQIFLNAAMRSA
jgi:hypothetical protein